MNKPIILVIDDDQAVRDAVSEDLKRENYDLLFAENGLEGLKIVRDSPPTVIILDLKMSVMGGLEFLDKIQLKPSDPYSVIVLTAYGDNDSFKACYDGGANSFIKKPFNLYEIRGAVENAIAVKQLTDQVDELVAERTWDLERRMRDVQEQINQYSQAFSEVLEEYHRVLGVIGDLARRTQSLAIPSLPPSPGLIDDKSSSTE